MVEEPVLIARVVAGDRAAFDALVAPHLAKLRGLLVRLVASPDDAEDLAQDTLVQAHRKLAEFRGESSFATWLLAIATRRGLTFLRTRDRWSPRAQLEAHEQCHDDAEFPGRLDAALRDSAFRYEVAEHIAYCFMCVGRALDPEESAAVLLSEVFELTNQEAAKALDMSESTFRHRLAAGRRQMIATFEDLCALVNKRGACHQCRTLRDAAPADRRGPDVRDLVGDDREARFQRRLAVIRCANVVDGPTARVHALMMRFLAEQVSRADPA